MNKRKQDIATVFLGLILILLLSLNHFMFTLTSRNAVKVGITAREALGPNYILLVGISLLLLVLILLKGDIEKRNFIAGIVASTCFGLTVLFLGQTADSRSLTSSIGTMSTRSTRSGSRKRSSRSAFGSCI